MFQQLTPCLDACENVDGSEHTAQNLEGGLRSSSLDQHTVSCEKDTPHAHSEKNSDCHVCVCACPCHAVALEVSSKTPKVLLINLHLPSEIHTSLSSAEVQGMDHVPLS